MNENGFWKVCEALDCAQRLELLRILLLHETTEFPCVGELAERLNLSIATVSVHLKKLATAGLVVSKRTERRIYYRAFATTEDGAKVVEALRTMFVSWSDEERFQSFREYAHALSHVRRHTIVRCLHKSPGLPLMELAVRADMPPKTAARLYDELGKAHIVDLTGTVIAPERNPEATLLELTLA